MKRLLYVGPLQEVYVPSLGPHTDPGTIVRREHPFEVESDAKALRIMQGNGSFVYADTRANPHVHEKPEQIGDDLELHERIDAFARARRTDTISLNGYEGTVTALDGSKTPSAATIGLRYYDALREVAERYFALWPEQRDAILETHRSEGARLMQEYGFADVAEMRAFMDEHRERKMGDTMKALAKRAQAKKRRNEEAFNPAWQIHFWLNAEAGKMGGIFGGYLTVGPGAIIPQNAIADALRYSDDELRALPPVAIRWNHHNGGFLNLEEAIGGKLPIESFYTMVAGENEGFQFADLPEDLRSLLAAFADPVNMRLEEPVHLTENLPNVRAAYHAFAKAFWSWHELGGFRLDLSRHGEDVAPRKTRPVFPIGGGETFLIPSAQVFQGAHRAMVSREGWDATGQDWPSFKDSSGVVYSIGGITGDGTFRPTTEEGLQADLAALEPEMSLAFAAAMGAWTQAFHSGTLSKSGAVLFHVNDILELRGLKRTRDGTFKPEQKRAVATQLRRLEKFYASGEAAGSDGKKKRLTGRLIDVVTAEAEDLFGMTPYGFAIRPGLAVAPFFEQSPQLAHFFTKLAALDTKQGVERIAYLLGLYLVFQFRVREKTRNYAQPFLVKTLLEGARVPIVVNAKHFTRFRDNTEGALDRLVAAGCVAGWEYEAGDAEALPDRGWFRPWLEKCRVKITPPEPVLESAALRSEGRQKAIATAAKGSSRKEPS